MKQIRKGEKYCEELLKIDGFGDDVQGLVGRGEAQLIREEWEEAVRTLEKAFEASGRSSQDVSHWTIIELSPDQVLTWYFFRESGTVASTESTEAT
jgi:hypothetical protein